jgi:hypothetical protein
MSAPKPSVALDPLDAVDPDTPTASAMLGIAKESLYRLAKRHLISGYLLAGKRRWDRESLRTYIARCKAAGPQFDPAPTGKRARGRPRKPKPETASSSAASAG